MDEELVYVDKDMDIRIKKYDELGLNEVLSFRKRTTRFGNYYVNGIFAFDENLNDYELKILIRITSENLYGDVQANCKKIRFSFLESTNSRIPDILNKVSYSSVLRKGVCVVEEFQEYIFDYLLNERHAE